MAAYVKTTWVNGSTALSADNMNKIENELVALDTGKVDKIAGKDLSANDFTDEYKTKLNGVEAGAEVNQYAFSNVKVGDSTVAADSKTDTLELVAGSNVTLTPDATNDKVTIASTNTTYNNATTSVAGLMSAADKTKLDGLFNLIYPVGSIYMSVNNTNPSTLFGGTWTAWGSGKVPVGVDTSQTPFNTVEKTGGSKDAVVPYHRHSIPALSGSATGGSCTISSSGGHSHTYDKSSRSSFKESGSGNTHYSHSGWTATYVGGNGAHTHTVPAHTHSVSTSANNTGYAGTDGNAANANLQPYITCYMWKRTA